MLKTNSDYKTEILKMLCTGMALGIVNDIPVKGKFKFLQNIRILEEGVLQARPKVDRFLELNYSPDSTPITSEVPYIICTIQNKGDNTFNRIVGVGSRLFTGNGSTLLMKANGFSTVPFTIVVFRPEEAILAYAYIADKLKFVKVSVDNQLSNVGLDAPTLPLTFYIPKPNRKTIDNVTVANIGDWNNLTGSAQVPTAEDRVVTTVTTFLADGAIPGFASIIPAAFAADIQVGTILTLNGADDVYVEEINPAINLTGAATISKIIYDTAPILTGKCTIILSTSSIDLERNSILYINSAEYVKVEEVTRDENGIPSIRTTTTATRAAGNSVLGIAAFRAYVVNSYVATNTIAAKCGKTQITADGVSSITKTVDVDLTNANNIPLNDNDFLHFSLKTNSPSDINEIQVQLGLPDFGENHWFYVITPNFFTDSAEQTASTISIAQQAAQREDILREQQRNIFTHVERAADSGGYDSGFDDPTEITPTISTVSQASLGQNQWTEIFIRLGDLQRVGSDPSKTKKDIKKIRISIDAKAAVDIYFDSIWVGGGAELETRVQGFAPYNYVWRVRDPVTKVPSNWSPPLREGIKTSRNSIALDIPTNTYGATYLVDIARFGGSLSDFRIIGSIINDGTDFIDKVSDRTAAANDPAGRKLPINSDKEIFDYYKPFTFIERPIKGTCDVVGTKWIWKTGDKLDISYPRGVGITINGKLNSLYTSPSDTEHVELENDLGSLTNVNFEIIAPRVTGKTLPIIFGPWGEGGASGLVIFGLKGIDGILFWLDGNSPDTMSDLNFVEVTSPSEPLLAGVVYDSFPVVFSNRRSFGISASFGNNILNFTARENANSKGVFGSYCVCVGRDYIYQLSGSADGIYRTQGGSNPQSITDGVLYNFFPHNGMNPTPIILVDGSLVNPPNFTDPNTLRLYYTEDFVFFRFVDIEGKDRVLVFDERMNDWLSYDTYFADKVNAFYQEEIIGSKELLIGIDGGVGKFANLTTREDDIEAKVLPFSIDFGNSRTLKSVDEMILSLNKGTEGLSVRNYFNNGDDSDVAIIIAGAISSIREEIVETIGEDDKYIKNIATLFKWTLSSLVKLYEEQFTWSIIGNEITDLPFVSDGGLPLRDKYWQGLVITADTYGEDKVLKFSDDYGIVQASITINHDGMITESYSFDEPFISHYCTMDSEDGVKWIFVESQYKFDLEPEEGKVWEGQETTFDILGFKSLKRNGISLRCTSDVTVTWIYDGIEESYTIDSTSGERDKIFFYLRPRKGKLIKLRMESEEKFRVYKLDCEVYVRGLNSPSDFEIKQPMGDSHRQTEITI